MSTTSESGRTCGCSAEAEADGCASAPSTGVETHVLEPVWLSMGESDFSLKSSTSRSPTEMEVESLSEKDETEPRLPTLRWMKLGIVMLIPCLEPLDLRM